MTSEEAEIFHEQFESENGIKSDMYDCLSNNFPTTYILKEGEQVSNRALKQHGYNFILKSIVLEQIKVKETPNLPKSKLNIDQVKTIEKKKFEIKNYGKVDSYLTLTYDDKSNNGYNSFSIDVQAYYYYRGTNKSYKDLITPDNFSDFIKECFPEYEYLTKWNLCSSVEPQYYVCNTLYWADVKNKNMWTPEQQRDHLKIAKFFAMWPTAKVEDLLSEKKLLRRLPALLMRFKRDMESLGFVY